MRLLHKLHDSKINANVKQIHPNQNIHTQHLILHQKNSNRIINAGFISYYVEYLLDLPFTLSCPLSHQPAPTPPPLELILITIFDARVCSQVLKNHLSSLFEKPLLVSLLGTAIAELRALSFELPSFEASWIL